MVGTGASVIIRAAAVTDACSIAAIYAHHVLHGTASFETEPPTPEFWIAKINDLIARKWPFLVAESEGVVIGYAYVTQFRDRAAYAHSCENSIYLGRDATGQGIGTLLLQALINAARDAGFEQMIAVISDETASVPLHRKLGFRHAGRMEKVGMKFGRLLDTVYMQRGLNEIS